MNKVTAFTYLLLFASIAMWSKAYEPDIRRRITVVENAALMATGMANSCAGMKEVKPTHLESSYNDNRV